MPKKARDPMEAGKYLGGQSGKAARAIDTRKRRQKSRLDSIMKTIRKNQSTDSNNR
jgi:hypothetical protein